MKFRIIALLFLLITSACVSKNQAMRVASPDEAKMAWHAFSVMATSQKESPYRVEASLRYSGPDISSARVSAILWGNGHTQTPYPLRLDLTAGLGTVVAKVKEDKQSFIAYSPQEKTAYIAKSRNKSLLSFGIPLPLTMADLSLFLTGHYGKLFLANKGNTLPPVVGVTQEGTRFALEKVKLPGFVEISPSGFLLSWSDTLDSSRWVIHFAKDKAMPFRPHKITITHAKGYEAIITVQELDLLKNPFTDRQLDLILPSGIKQKTLER